MKEKARGVDTSLSTNDFMEIRFDDELSLGVWGCCECFFLPLIKKRTVGVGSRKF